MARERMNKNKPNHHTIEMKISWSIHDPIENLFWNQKRMGCGELHRKKTRFVTIPIKHLTYKNWNTTVFKCVMIWGRIRPPATSKTELPEAIPNCSKLINIVVNSSIANAGIWKYFTHFIWKYMKKFYP